MIGVLTIWSRSYVLLPRAGILSQNSQAATPCWAMLGSSAEAFRYLGSPSRLTTPTLAIVAPLVIEGTAHM